MSLTPEEQERLRQLEAFIAEEETKLEGAKAVEVARPRESKRSSGGFRLPSLIRTPVNILRNSAQGMIDTLYDIDDATLGRAVNIGQRLIFGKENAKRSRETSKTSRVILPVPRGTEDAGTAEKIITGVGEFLVPFAGWSKAFGVFKAATRVGRLGRSTAAGIGADFVSHDPIGNNFANVLKDTFGLDHAMIEALTSEQDDDALLARFKSAAAAAPLGIASDALFELGGRALRGYRDWKSSRGEAEAIVEAMRKDYTLKPSSRSFMDAAQASDEAAEAAEGVTRPKVRKGSEEAAPAADEAVGGAPRGSMEEKQAAAAETANIKTPEDVLAYLRRKTGDDVPDNVLEDIAQKLLDGDPGDALARLGIDPAALDFRSLNDPEVLRHFHEGLAEAVARISKRLGRTGTRVTEVETHMAAKVLATTDDALRDLHGDTNGLAERLMAARMLVETHAHRFLHLADEAMKELEGGAPGKAWAAFEEAFDRHAYFQGAVRGASSEVGRALRSLRFSTANAQEAAQRVREGMEKEGSDVINTVREDAVHWLRDMQTDAERINAIREVREAGGDVGELTRFVRVKSMDTRKRVDMAIRETTGNLFSDSTLWLNTAAGAAMLGMRAAAKAIAATLRAPLGLVSQRNADLARFHTLDALTYTDGMLSGFGEAYRNVIHLLQRDIGAEISLHANALGFDKLAKRAALMSARGSEDMTRARYVRDDVVNHRFLSITPDEHLRLGKIVKEMDGPKLMQRGLKGLLASAGAAVTNVYGSAARFGTLAYVNSPDQFVGTLAAKAGAQSRALRIAAEEASEMGIQGEDLTAYLKARSHQLTRFADAGHSDEAFEDGQLAAIRAAGNAEAREVLFQDRLEFAATRHLQRVHQDTFGANLVVAFYKTPMRILERTMIDYTPLGLAKGRIRKAILAGGPDADEAYARIALGSTMAATAFLMAEDRIMVGRDGGHKNSARIARPSYSIKIGEDVYEMHRVDPLGTIMGWGADLASVLHSVEDDMTREALFWEVFPAMLWASAANVLEKSWLTDVKLLTDWAGAQSEEESATRFRRYMSNFTNRGVPGAGTQRAINRKTDPFIREADALIEHALKTTLGGDVLPVQRDQLGRPRERTLGERLGGWPGGPMSDDPLDQELETLAFDWPKPNRSVWGVRLNATQYSRLLELRGQIVRDPQTGMTMEETLRALIEEPDWDTLTRAARIEEIRNEIRGFGKLANEAMFEEDPQFKRDYLRVEVNTEGELEGWNRDERERALQQYAIELGLE